MKLKLQGLALLYYELNEYQTALSHIREGNKRRSKKRRLSERKKNRRVVRSTHTIQHST